MNINIFKIEVFIPKDFIDELREKVNAVGACKYGNYDMCTSYYEVKGTWRPLEGTNPYLGTKFKLEKAKEYKMEFICKREYVTETLKVIKNIHPYEEPVINVLPLYNEFF